MGKQIGIGLICLVLCSFGFVYVYLAHRQLDAAKDALYGIELLKTRVCAYLEPLQEALRETGDAARLLSALQTMPLPWTKEQLVEGLRGLGLGKRDAQTVYALLEGIPRQTSGDQALFQAAQEELQTSIALQEAALTKEAALYPKLGLLSGLMALLLLC